MLVIMMKIWIRKQLSSIKVKLLGIHLLISAFIIFSTCGIFYAYCGDMQRESVRNDMRTRLESISDTLATIERCMERACTYISEDEKIPEMLMLESEDQIEYINNQVKVGYEFNNMFGTVFDIQDISPYVHVLKFYFDSSLPFIKDGYVNKDDSYLNGIVSMDALQDIKWFNDMTAKAYGSGMYIYSNTDSEPYLFFVRQMKGLDGTVYGYCKVGINLDHLFDVTPPINAMITGTEDKVLYNGFEKIGISDIESILNQVSHQDYDEMAIYTSPVDGIEYFINEEICDNGLTIITATSADEEAIVLNRLLVLVFIIAISLIFIDIVVFFMISNKITSPLKKLEKFMSVGNLDGDFPVLSSFNTDDEIGSIYSSAKILIDKIKEKNELEQAALEKEKMMEIKMRQIQIGPHFLNNALNTLSCRAMLDGNSNIADYAVALASILEYALKNPEELVTLETELEYLKKYVYLQNYAYEDSITLNIMVVPEALREVKVAKLILQPLCENSILHGFCNDMESFNINVDIRELNDMLIINIEDDGADCDVEKINQMIISGESKGIGIKNVNERLKMYFGDNCGLYYEKKDNKTVATLKILKMK